jgi:DNA-binding CsgD family transcriptional regulator
MSSILGILRRSRQLGREAVILVTGDAGTGKSAMLESVGSEARGLGFVVGASRTDAGEQVSPAAPVLSALRSGREPLLNAAAFAEVVALIGRPQQMTVRIVRELREIACRSTIVVIVDDVHRLDPMSRLVVRGLTAELAGCPVVWVFSSRGGEEDLTEEPIAAEVVALNPLAPADVIAMAEDRFGRDLPGRALGVLSRLSGNPGLTVQVLDGLGGAGATEETDHGQDLPTEFVIDVRRQMGWAHPRVEDLLKILAALNRSITLEEATRLSGAETQDVHDSLGEAVRSGLLIDVDGRFSYRHEAVRVAVYATVSAQARRELHHRCADHLVAEGRPPMEVVAHARAWATVGDEKAVALIRAAAHEALATAPETAADLMAEAFRLTRPGHPSWPEVGAEAVEILGQVESTAAALSVAESVLARVDAPLLAARIRAATVGAGWVTGASSSSLSAIEATLADPDVRGGMRSRLQAARALVLAHGASESVAQGAAEFALKQAHAAHDLPAQAFATQALGEIARRSGNYESSLAKFRTVRALAPSNQFGVGDEIMALLALDRFEEGADGRIERQAVLPSVLRARMWQAFHLSRLDEVETRARALAERSRRGGNRLHRLESAMLISAVALIRDRPEEARARLRSMLGPAGPTPEDEMLLPEVRVLQGWLEFVEGRPGAAVPIFTVLLNQEMERHDHLPRDPWWLRILMAVAVETRDEMLVGSVLSIAGEGAARNPGTSRCEGLFLQAQGLINDEPDVLKRAWELLRTCPRPLVRADVGQHYGRLLARQGRRGAARIRLAEAWETYRQVGAYREQATVQQLLRAVGARGAQREPGPAREALGWEALTDTERRVALLISSGHTNRSAAAELGLSPNTVSTHLRSIFSKLRIRSRVQLTNVVNERMPLR